MRATTRGTNSSDYKLPREGKEINGQGEMLLVPMIDVKINRDGAASDSVTKWHLVSDCSHCFWSRGGRIVMFE